MFVLAVIMGFESAKHCGQKLREERKKLIEK